MPRHIAVIGSVGVPANYGGFETVAENLARYHKRTNTKEKMTIYCSAKAYDDRARQFMNAELRYINIDANGVSSVLYDAVSIIDALRRGSDTLLILGVSGALIMPLVRMFSKVRIVTNIDGVEWRREKWGWLQRAFLKWSEAAAVRFSHTIIADNEGIADQIETIYGAACTVVAYGGDHAVDVEARPATEVAMLKKYAFAVCRIEPENNLDIILQAFAMIENFPLVVVGNWENSGYGSELKRRYFSAPGIIALDPIYDVAKLKSLRSGASIYIHGHSAGGTNPSLVEMMFFGVPVLAFDCCFNRYTTEGRAQFFSTTKQLQALIELGDIESLESNGRAMREIAQARYTWDVIGAAYFDLLR